MSKAIRWLCTHTALAGALLLVPSAQATTSVIDFEPPSLTGLYFGGDTFQQLGYRMTVDYDSALVDGASSLGSAAPTGNASQFYSQLNEGALFIERGDSGLFSLNGFDAAFIPLTPPAAGQTVIAAVGWFAGNLTPSPDYGIAWLFDRSFANYSDPLDFSNFSEVRQVAFFSCTLDSGGVCASPIQNNGQFAIDNINVTAVPEPTTTVMLSLGLLGLALLAKRRAG